jgi:hypothetical protein
MQRRVTFRLRDVQGRNEAEMWSRAQPIVMAAETDLLPQSHVISGPTLTFEVTQTDRFHEDGDETAAPYFHAHLLAEWIVEDL